jgi:hypothetical protein
MLTPHLSKNIRTTFHRGLGPPISDALAKANGIPRFTESHPEFLNQAQRMFMERRYQKVNSGSTLHGEFLLFIRNEALDLVYFFPSERYVTTIEIESCWDAQCRLGAQPSSVIGHYLFSTAAIQKARKLGIERLVI